MTLLVFSWIWLLNLVYHSLGLIDALAMIFPVISDVTNINEVSITIRTNGNIFKIIISYTMKNYFTLKDTKYMMSF